MSLIFGGHFRLRTRLGAGSFGEVFEAEEIKTHEIVGLKFEPKRTNSPQLEHESKIYKDLQDGINFPRIYGFESDEKFNFMSMELLGKSLDELFHICNRKFSLKTVLQIIDQSLNAIEFVHKMHYIYSDVKPNNFLIGRGDSANQIFLIDFGLSKKYIDESTGEHIPFKEDQSIVGTARYASANALLGNTQSRKDDLIALGYMWIYFMKGDLPWIGMEREDFDDRSQNNYKYDEVISLKKYTSAEKLCEGLPNQFAKYLTAVSNLAFDEEPKYSEYRLMFRKLFFLCQFCYDYKYDWTGNPLVEPPAPSPRRSNSLHSSARPKSSREVPAFAQRLCPLTPCQPTQRSSNPIPMEIRHKRRNSISNAQTNPLDLNSPRNKVTNLNANENRKTNSQAINVPGEENENTQPHSKHKDFKPIKCRLPSSPNEDHPEVKNEKVRVSPPIPRPKGKISPRQAKSMIPTNTLANEFESFEHADRDNNAVAPTKPPSLLQTKSNSKNNIPIIPIIPIANKNRSSKTKCISPRRTAYNGCDILPL